MNAIEAGRRRAVEQTLASWRISGFEAGEAYLCMLDRYITGELSLSDLRAETHAAFGLPIKPVA